MKLLAVLLSLATLSLGRSARALSGDSLVPAGAGAGAGASSLLSPGGGGNSLPLRGVADGSGLSLSDLLGPAAAFVPGSHGAPVGPSKASSYVPQAQHLGGSYEKQYRKRETQTTPADVRPTPEPTGASSASTTVHIIDEHDFALLLPDRPDGASSIGPTRVSRAYERVGRVGRVQNSSRMRRATAWRTARLRAPIRLARSASRKASSARRL